MSDENTNTQTPPAVPVTPAGKSMEEIKAELQADFEKQREGLIRDLQEERRKRQELEASHSAPAPSPANQDVNADELGKVLNPYIAPLKAQVAATTQELEGLRQEKAKNYLVDKTGKSWDTIENDRNFQERMIGVVRRYGVTGNIVERTERAYELMQLEDLKTQDAERKRAAQTASAQTMPSGTSPAQASGGKEYSVADFNAMPVREYDALAAKGGFKKVGDKLVYTPRS